MPRVIHFLSFLLLFFILTEMHAQKGYEPGYVITKSFDTLPGRVKDRKDAPFAQIYKKIRFKSDGPFTKKYNPKQLQGYVRGGDHFESHWILVNTRFLKIEYLSKRNLGREEFFKVVESGYLTYYHWEWLDQESSVVERVELFKRRDEDYFIRVTQGLLGLRMNALEKYFEDSPEIMAKIRNKELRRPQEIAKYYNEWLK
jgi:hypothetical protein